MNNNVNPQQNIDEIRELLSPYLDGEVTEAEREQVEAGLAALPELQEDLDSLRQTVNLLAMLPAMAAPRPFTLSEANVQPAATAQPKRRMWLSGWLGGLAAAAVALLCVLAAGGMFLGSQLMGGAGSAPAEIALQQDMAPPQAAEAELAVKPAEESAAALAPATEIEEEPAPLAAAPTPAPPAGAPAPVDEAAREAAPEAPLMAAEAPPAAAEMAGAAEAVTEDGQAPALAPPTDADDGQPEEAILAEAAKVAPAENNATLAAAPESRSAADSVAESASGETESVDMAQQKISPAEATPAPSPTVLITAMAASTPTPLPTGSVAQTIETTVPVQEIRKPEFIFTVLNLGGILLFSALVLTGIAIMIFKSSRKP